MGGGVTISAAFNLSFRCRDLNSKTLEGTVKTKFLWVRSPHTFCDDSNIFINSHWEYYLTQRMQLPKITQISSHCQSTCDTHQFLTQSTKFVMLYYVLGNISSKVGAMNEYLSLLKNSITGLGFSSIDRIPSLVSNWKPQLKKGFKKKIVKIRIEYIYFKRCG